MDITNINTIDKLKKALSKFDNQLPVAIFDSNRGYMSVAYKKEQKKENGNVFQWLTFYPHETIQMYTIEQLQTYLRNLPPQAPICMQDENEHYTDLFLSIDGMKDNNKFLQWLVISNELEYDRFFRPQLETVDNKQSSNLLKALEKMLNEVNKESSDSIERIHQYLCKQTDEKLFTGILTEGKTIKEALTYCSVKARQQAQNEPFAIIEDDIVYQWVKDYFIHYELPKKVKKSVPATKKKASKVTKEPVNTVSKTTDAPTTKKEVEEEQQISLFALV